MKKTLSVIGLGKLGMPFLAVLASAGYRVIGTDVSLQNAQAMLCADAEIIEPQLQAYLKEHGKNITLTAAAKHAVLASEISFVIVPTPSQKNGSFSLKYIFQVCRTIGQALKTKNTRHTIVIVSTVSPKSMEKIQKMIETISGKKMGKDFGLCYSPEFIALGQVIQDLTDPDFILIGESDSQSGLLVEETRLHMCQDKGISVHRTRFINAEIAKLAINTYLTTKITFGNMIARIAEKTPGASAQEIVDIVGSDVRIGKAYLKGGLAYGGPCFPRDNNALSHFLKEQKVPMTLPAQIHKLNISQNDYLFQLVKKHITKHSVIGVLGLSYKPQTGVLDESPGHILSRLLKKSHLNVVAFDPSSQEGSLEGVLGKSTIIVIATPWAEFSRIDFDQYSTVNLIIDCWDIMKKKHTKAQRIVLGNYIDP